MTLRGSKIVIMKLGLELRSQLSVSKPVFFLFCAAKIYCHHNILRHFHLFSNLFYTSGYNTQYVCTVVCTQFVLLNSSSILPCSFLLRLLFYCKTLSHTQVLDFICLNILYSALHLVGTQCMLTEFNIKFCNECYLFH